MRLVALRAGLRRRLAATAWRCRDGLFPPRTITTARSVSLSLQRDNAVTRMRAETFATKEPGTLDWLDRLSTDDVLFDIGANVGIYSLYAARRRVPVVAIEPEWSNLHYLRDNVLANGLRDAVRVVGLALSDATGLSALHLHDVTPGAALHTESKESLVLTASGTRVMFEEIVWSVRLDDLCKHMAAWPTAIKLDVDGTEVTILRGAPEALRRTRTILVERPGLQRDAEGPKLLREAGLVERGSRDENTLWERPE